MVLLAVLPLPLLAIFGRLERAAPAGGAVSVWRLPVGVSLICGGVALLALDGIASDNVLAVRLGVVSLPLVDGALAAVRTTAGE